MIEYRSHIASVRRLAQDRLVQLEGSNWMAEQSFLFQAGNFVGIRFRLGHHRCDWIFEDSGLKFYRLNELLVELRVTLDSKSSPNLAPALVFPIAPIPTGDFSTSSASPSPATQTKAA